MATLLESHRVQIQCSCGLSSPITKLYFCKHCLKLRCGRCVSHEVDSHYCPNCLENMPSAEARIKKNRCPNCLDCPSCKHTLSTRATSMALPDPSDPSKATTKKVYYLACGFCRWTSRDAGISDKEVASGAWVEPEKEHTKRIRELLDYYRQLASREKLEREKKKYTRRRTYFHIQEKLSAPTSSGVRRTSGLLTALSSFNLKEGEQAEEVTVKVIEPLEDVDPVPTKYFTQPVVLEKVPSIRQRFLQPEMTAPIVNDLYPRHKHLLIKRSQRCRECEHNLSKPEFNPSSIKFKIQLIALHHIPDIRVFLVPKLNFQRESLVTLLVTNPVQNATTIKLESPEKTDNESDAATAKVVVPDEELTLAPKDDTSEFDDASTDTKEYSDKAEFVHFRKAHKLGILVKVTPLKAVGDVTIAFKLKYDYKNATPSLRTTTETQSEVETVWLQHPVTVNLGPLAQNH
ncbi:dynactin subunit 4-like [Acanthaster planci]|uniref:Dynactin subunit 4 n=1 Tax=Acanthaster planci TaxID=133434 RepID=A0A8B7ZAW9_ACAPL|nr:dynactin subunit 4-like [Acanthaster planci]